MTSVLTLLLISIKFKPANLSWPILRSTTSQQLWSAETLRCSKKSHLDCISRARFLSMGLGLQTSQRYSSGMLFLSRPMHTTCCQTLKHKNSCLRRRFDQLQEFQPHLDKSVLCLSGGKILRSNCNLVWGWAGYSSTLGLCYKDSKVMRQTKRSHGQQVFRVRLFSSSELNSNRFTKHKLQAFRE